MQIKTNGIATVKRVANANRNFPSSIATNGIFPPMLPLDAEWRRKTPFDIDRLNRAVHFSLTVG